MIAVDIPSGADADVMGEQIGAVARADAVVTFTAPRPAHIFGMLTSGPTLISPIGSPDEAIVSSLHLNLITAREIAPLIGPRPPATRTREISGTSWFWADRPGKAGAAAMAGMAALRAGAGLSTVATAKSVLPTVAGFHPELMTELARRNGSRQHFAGAAGTWLGGSIGEREDCAGGWSRHFAPYRDRRFCAQRCQEIQNADCSGCRRPECIRRPCCRAERQRAAARHYAASWRDGSAHGSTIAAVQRDRHECSPKFCPGTSN